MTGLNHWTYKLIKECIAKIPKNTPALTKSLNLSGSKQTLCNLERIIYKNPKLAYHLPWYNIWCSHHPHPYPHKPIDPDEKKKYQVSKVISVTSIKLVTSIQYSMTPIPKHTKIFLLTLEADIRAIIKSLVYQTCLLPINCISHY